MQTKLQNVKYGSPFLREAASALTRRIVRGQIEISAQNLFRATSELLFSAQEEESLLVRIFAG